MRPTLALDLQRRRRLPRRQRLLRSRADLLEARVVANPATIQLCDRMVSLLQVCPEVGHMAWILSDPHSPSPRPRGLPTVDVILELGARLEERRHLRQHIHHVRPGRRVQPVEVRHASRRP